MPNSRNETSSASLPASPAPEEPVTATETHCEKCGDPLYEGHYSVLCHKPGCIPVSDSRASEDIHEDKQIARKLRTLVDENLGISGKELMERWAERDKAWRKGKP